MCTGKRPQAPEAPAPRQAPRMPDAPAIMAQNQDMLSRRATMASMILTAPGMGAAPTASKQVLGA